MHKNFKEIANERNTLGTITVEKKEKMLQQWNLYNNELFHDNKREKFRRYQIMEQREILKSELISAIIKKKRNEVTERNEIFIEMWFMELESYSND